MTNNIIEEWEDWNPEQWFQITSSNTSVLSLSSLKENFNVEPQLIEFEI